MAALNNPEFRLNKRPSPPPSDLLPLGGRNRFVSVQTFCEKVYVCIREHRYNSAVDKWLPTRTGLNLTAADWQRYKHYRTSGLIRSALEQEVDEIPPQWKPNQEHEELEPTSWPESAPGNTTLHRIVIAPVSNKCVIVSRIYSSNSEVCVSFLQFPAAETGHQQLIPLKSIHLSLDEYEALKKLEIQIDELVDSHLRKLLI